MPALNLTTFDPTSPGFLQDPYPTYEAFRTGAPVAKIKYPDVPGRKPESSFWVFDDALIREVCDSKNKKIFLKQKLDTGTADRGLFTMDPEDHTEARKLLEPMVAAITAKAITSAAKVANDIVSAILQGPKKEIDFVAAFAEPFTQQVFFEVFGVADTSEQAHIVSRVQTIFEYLDLTMTDVQQSKADTAKYEMAVKLDDLFKQPMQKDTLMGWLKTMPIPTVLDRRHRAGHATSFCVGGYLSNQFLLALGLQHTLGDTKAKADMQHAANQADSEPLLLQNAIDEIMRFDAPLQMADRYAAQDTLLGEVNILKDDRVTLVYGSANRDVKRFALNPELLDLTRGGGHGFAFGHGIHECIAYVLARTVATAGFKTLFTRLPNLALKNPIARYWPSPYYRRIDTLMVTF